MRLTVFHLLIVVALLCCRGPVEKPKGVKASAQAVRPIPAASIALTAEKVQAFVSLKERELELPTVRLMPDGGMDMTTLKSRYDVLAEARRKSGLSSRELDLLREMMSQVIGKRALAQMFDMGPQVEKLKALEDKLPQEQRAVFEQSVGKLTSQKAALEDLSSERQKFGATNVDLLLRFEKPLIAAYRQSLEPDGGL